MYKNNLEEIIERSLQLRKKYHELELETHGTEWTVEEDALAFLSDAALVGRNIMAQQQRWPKANSHDELEHKIGESIWWLIVLANRTDIDVAKAVEDFLSKTEKLVG